MLLDARGLPAGETVACDLCVVGAGAAGITLALDCLAEGLQVVVLESGDLELEGETQALYEGANLGLPYFPLDTTQLRFFGGTTNHWAGYCVPFADHAFAERPWIPLSGWPFGRAEIEAHERAALELLGLPVGRFGVDDWQQELAAPPLPFDPQAIETDLFLIRPVRMGEQFREPLAQAAEIVVHLNANAVEIETDAAARSARAIRVRTLAGNDYAVAARAFVLAAGGIENARILLLSDGVQPEGLGNGHGFVGRCITDHAYCQAAVIQPVDPGVPIELYERHRQDGFDVMGRLRIAAAAQRAEQLVPVAFALEPVLEPAYYSDGAKSLRLLRRSLAGGRMPDDLARHVGNVLGDVVDLGTLGWKTLRHGRFPIDHIECWLGLAPAPHPDSRVTLGAERDALGLRRVELEWRLTPLDKRSARRSVEILGREVGRTGLGRLRSFLSDDDDTWPDDLEGSHHLMGATRMSDDPATGVVDRNCRVHGLDNLFVAGASVFPTPELGSPTLMLMALTLRLAEHLRNDVL